MATDKALAELEAAAKAASLSGDDASATLVPRIRPHLLRRRVVVWLREQKVLHLAGAGLSSVSVGSRKHRGGGTSAE